MLSIILWVIGIVAFFIVWYNLWIVAERYSFLLRPNDDKDTDDERPH